MTIYDASMLGIILLGVIWGAWRGLISQVASLSSLILGYVIAKPVSVHLARYIPAEPIVARASAMLAVYLLSTVGIFVIAGVLRKLVKTLQLGAVDRQLGMLLGAVEGTIIGLVGTLFVVSLAPESREPIFASPSGRMVGRLMDAVGPALPEETRDVLAPFWNPDWQPSGKGLLAARGRASSKADKTAATDEKADESITLSNFLDRVLPDNETNNDSDDETTSRTERRRVGRRDSIDNGDADARPRRR